MTMINSADPSNVPKNDFEELMKIQRLVNSAVLRELEEDKTISLISMVNELTSESQPTQIEIIFVEAQGLGFDEADVLGIIEKMKKDNLIFEPSDGFVQKRA